jgi:homoserine dehydrogenase
MKIAFIGFGGVARAFARMLISRRWQLQERYGLSWRVTAIATANHGCVSSNSGLDLDEVLERLERNATLAGIADSANCGDAASLIEKCKADILFETTPLNPETGEPAASYLRQALSRRINAVTANKGPIAFAYQELSQLAARHGAQFRFEGTVMDGAPVFNMVESCLPGDRVLEFCGVLNSTTNYILTGMEEGRSYEACLEEARGFGIVEANPDYDLDGHDAAVKAVALANVLMGANVRPQDVERKGIRGITSDDLKSAAGAGLGIRLIARAKAADGRTIIRVGPERVPVGSPMGSLRGTSNALTIKTELMGELTLIEANPGIDQTAYALLSDMIIVHSRLDRTGGTH